MPSTRRWTSDVVRSGPARFGAADEQVQWTCENNERPERKRRAGGYLMGFRFQKRLSIIPGLLRINLSKSGTSVSAGPEGADINIGRNGVTTNAGIPGTGLSYRQKVGGGKGMLAVALVVAGLGWWAFQHQAKIRKLIAPIATQTSAAAPVNTATSALRYVHRAGSILREEPKLSGKILNKKTKDDIVTLITQTDGWAKVTDGNRYWLDAGVSAWN
jgi:hypothetical protein